MKKRVVTITLVIALLAASAGTALAFAVGPKISVAVTGVREQTVSAASSGVNFLVGMQGSASNQHQVCAQLVSEAGTLVGPRINTGRLGGCPSVAFGGDRYLLVWSDDATHPNDNILGRFVSSTGVLGGASFPISMSAGNQEVTGAESDGTNFLVVWEDYRNDADGDGQCDAGEGTCVDVYARLVSPTGAVLTGEIPIAVIAGQQKLPAVAFGGDKYLVVWSGKRTSGPELWDIWGRFVTKTGVSSAPFMISLFPSPRYNPVSLDFDGANFLVAWNRDMGTGYPNPSVWDIRGRLVRAVGGFASGELIICSAAGNQVYPFVSFNGLDYLVTWSDGRLGDANMNIWGRFFGRTGAPTSGEIIINADAGGQYVSPTVFGFTKHLVLWDSGNGFEGTVSDIFGALVAPTPYPPANVSLTPTTGPYAVDTPYTFTSKQNDPNGYKNLANCHLLIHTTAATQMNAAYFRYDENLNKLYVRDNTNMVWIGGFAPGSVNVIENSYCRLYCAQTSVSGLLGQLTINWKVSFKPSMAGRICSAWLLVYDDTTLRDGWDQVGGGIRIGRAPSNYSIWPTSGSYATGTKTTFTTRYSDPDGFGNLSNCYLLLNTSFGTTNAVFVRYDANTNLLHLKNDADNYWGTGAAPGSATVLENSQCELYCAETTTSVSVTTRTVNWRIEFKPSMSNKSCTAWMLVYDDIGLRDGYDRMGTGYRISQAPVNWSLLPSGGTIPISTWVTLRSTYVDPDGAANLDDCYLLLNTSLSTLNAVFVRYDANENKLYLKNDANTAWLGGYAPGTLAAINNTQCALSCQATTRTPSGTALIIDWRLYLKPTMAHKTLPAWMLVYDDFGIRDGYDHKGTFTVP